MTPENVLARVATLLPSAVAALDALGTLRDDPELAFDMLADLTAVDYLPREPRFEVIYQLNSLTHHHRLRVKACVPGDDPQIASASSLWNSALWAEREAWDLFGIRFAGHPDLRRILMYPEFEGHPLRKDYPVNKRQPLVPERDPIRQPWFPRQGGR